MTSRLVKTVRKLFRIPPRPRRTAVSCVREGHTFHFRHATYGPLWVLAHDQGVSWHVVDGHSIWEPELVKIFEREILGGQHVLDVGANLGLHTILLSQHLSRLSRGGRVIAMEPHPQIAPLANLNCAGLANVECLPKVASDEDGSWLYMPDILTSANAGGVGVTAAWRDGMFPVETVTIDSLELSDLEFMKVDVEGHELRCIRGAAETIRRCRPTMIVEILGGNCLQTASPPIAAEIRRRVEVICGLGYSAKQVSVHDYLFRPR